MTTWDRAPYHGGQAPATGRYAGRRPGRTRCIRVRVTISVHDHRCAKGCADRSVIGHDLVARGALRSGRDFLRAALNDRFRSRHTMPATAPRMITTPMAISQDMRAKTTPIGPYFLSSEVTTPGEDDRKDCLHATARALPCRRRRGTGAAKRTACDYTTAVPAMLTLAACRSVSGVTGCRGVRYQPRSWLSTPNTTA